MSWLLGSVAGGGVLGVTILAVIIYVMYRANRDDLWKLVAATKELANKTRLIDALERANEELQHALDEKTNEVARERAARAVDPPRPSGDPAVDLHDAVRRLSGLSKLSGTSTTKDGDGPARVHGPGIPSDK